MQGPCDVGLGGEWREVRVIDVDRQQFEAVASCHVQKRGIGRVGMDVGVELSHVREVGGRIGIGTSGGKPGGEHGGEQAAGQGMAAHRDLLSGHLVIKRNLE